MSIEKEIQAKGLTAPRVTPADIENNIKSVHYFTAAEGEYGKLKQSGDALPDSLSLLTFCVLVLQNGYTVTGESACASPENYNQELGEKIARQNAVNKVWPLMGYALKKQLCDEKYYAEAPKLEISTGRGGQWTADELREITQGDNGQVLPEESMKALVRVDASEIEPADIEAVAELCLHTGIATLEGSF